jgi:YD repeat-containing protein
LKQSINSRDGYGAIIGIAVVVSVLGACDSDRQTLEIPQDPGAYSSDISYEYDDLNRLTLVRYANGDVMRYSYDESGNILSVEMDKAN